MWWMLLLALEGDAYRTEIIVRTKQECTQLKTSDRDLCVPVEVRFLNSASENPFAG